MGEFEKEVSYRKTLSRSAVKRVSGAKSKKCSLPSDNLTKKQIKALSGEVTTYNISQAMTWEDFKRLPDDIAKLHLEYIVNTYRPTAKAIADYFGVHPVYLSRCLKARRIRIDWPNVHGFIPSEEWLDFMRAAE